MNNPHKPPCIHPLLYLPGSETGSAHEMTTGLNLHILVVLGTDLTKLESGAHLTVQLVLFLRGEKKTWQDGNITQEQQHLRSFWKKKKKGEEKKKKSLEGSRAIGSCGGVVWVSVQWLQNESVHCTYKILRTCMSLKRSSTVFKTKLWIKMLIILKIL